MAQEPILWVRPGYKPPQRVRPGPDGEPIVEKFPATASPPEDHPLHGRRIQRWDRMLSDDGNVYNVPWTGAAADYQVDHERYGRLLKGRMRTRGWFPYGECPLRLVAAGHLDVRYLSPAVREPGERPCLPGTCNAERPCQHTLAEEEHRKARHTRREAKRAVAFKSEAEKIMVANQEQQKLHDAATTSMVKDLAESIKALIGAGGVWPMARPNMTPEEFAAQVAAGQGSSAPPTTDEAELDRALLAADSDDSPPEEPPARPRKGGR